MRSLESPPLAKLHTIANAPNAPESLRSNRVERSARMRFAVAQALAQGRVQFEFQPIVRAARRDFPAFHEMLARIVLPTGQMLPAGAFIPFVEEGPIGRAIDRLALVKALETLSANPALRLSINMSPLSMGEEGYLAVLAQWTDRDPGAVGRLILEVTETAAIRDAGTTAAFMDHAQGLGIAFALDDFGAGATGFRHFRDFRFDIAKIDGGYIDGVASSPDCQVLVECLMGVARHFDMFVVAERVTSEADAEWLTRLGVDCLQGYLIGAPRPDFLTPGDGPEQGGLAAAG